MGSYMQIFMKPWHKVTMERTCAIRLNNKQVSVPENEKEG